MAIKIHKRIKAMGLKDRLLLVRRALLTAVNPSTHAFVYYVKDTKGYVKKGSKPFRYDVLHTRIAKEACQ